MEESGVENGGGHLALMPSCMSSWVDNGSVESHRYYLARRTILEMLKDRGYDAPDSDLNLSLHEFRSIFSEHPDLERLRISLPLLSNPSKKIIVIFCGTDKVKLGVIRGIRGQIANDTSLTRLILILQSEMTSQAKQDLSLFQVDVEIFQGTLFLVNLAKRYASLWFFNSIGSA
ncbi:RNA polymerase [Macleaya cordata]|uniref:RNA polymerase n=1 Tax=Macleaya cordata TaxID=56857 RepID=A0A200QK95_MACCD|nr:RNA polymerase [Macleaya cordata]